MSEPRVTRIRVEYEDGSFDTIENLPQDDKPFYDLRRKRAVRFNGREGLHSSGAIAALLYITAFHGRRREYSFADPEILKLCRVFAEERADSGTE